MNAGGVTKACKSNGQVDSARIWLDSGKRVSNTLVTYLKVQHNPAKAGLILDVVFPFKGDE